MNRAVEDRLARASLGGVAGSALCGESRSGSGDLLSPEFHDVQLAPTIVGTGTNTADKYWAMGFWS